MKTISFIIPCYNSENTIGDVVNEITDAMKTLGIDIYEIILINDSSPDNVYKVICDICEKNTRVRGIDLAKNFGQHNALMAGINHAQYDIVVFLDDDGQTPACEVGKLISALGDDCDIVFAKYENKKHNFFRNFGSKINDFMAEILIGKPKNLSISSYVACKKFVIDEIKHYTGNCPYLSGLLIRTSNKIKNVPVNHRKREAGHSNYTLRKLLALWLNGFTAFSVKPLRVATIVGFLTAMTGFIYGIYIIIRWFFRTDLFMGWSSTMAALLFIGGMIMVILGLMGEYIGRTYLNVNNAPQFVIRRRVGYENEDNK